MEKIEQYLKEKGLDKNSYLMQKNRDGSVAEMYLKDLIEEYISSYLISDEEIEKRAEKFIDYDSELALDSESVHEQLGFEKGAKWVRDILIK